MKKKSAHDVTKEKKKVTLKDLKKLKKAKGGFLSNKISTESGGVEKYFYEG